MVFARAALKFACLVASELIAHRETNCSTSWFWQPGHTGEGDECSTRYSNWRPHCRHLYSKTGIKRVDRPRIPSAHLTDNRSIPSLMLEEMQTPRAGRISGHNYGLILNLPK